MKSLQNEIDDVDMEIMQRMYRKVSRKSIIFELKIARSTYSRRIKKLLDTYDLDDIQQLRKWVYDNLRA